MQELKNHKIRVNKLRQSLTDQEKIRVLTEVVEANIAGVRINSLGEVELYPKGLSFDSWYWLLYEQYDIKNENKELFQKLLENLHEKGLIKYD